MTNKDIRWLVGTAGAIILLCAAAGDTNNVYFPNVRVAQTNYANYSSVTNMLRANNAKITNALEVDANATIGTVWIDGTGAISMNYNSANVNFGATSDSSILRTGVGTLDVVTNLNVRGTNAVKELVVTNGVRANTIVATNSVVVGGTIGAGSNLLEAPELYTGSFKLYRGALTPVDAGVSLDFGSTNRYWSITLTGAVTFATANLTAGKHANLMVTGVATNANYTWPANWIWIGFKPTFIGANKHGDLYLKATSAADAGVWAYYGEEN